MITSRSILKSVLAQFLDCDAGLIKPVSQSVYQYGPVAKRDEEKYVVYNDPNEVRVDALMIIRQALNQYGYEGLNDEFRTIVTEQGALNLFWFDNYLNEYTRGYVENLANISSEVYANRFIEQCMDNHLITKDNLDDKGNYKGDIHKLQDRLVDLLVSEEADPVVWYDMNFGELNNVIEVNNLFDKGLAVDIISNNGGMTYYLAPYDHIEHTITMNDNLYYIYRIK